MTITEKPIVSAPNFVEVKTTARVAAYDTADTMITALEGGSNYWLGSIKIKGNEAGLKLKDEKTYEGDFSFTIVWTDAEDEDMIGEVLINRARVTEAWQKFTTWLEKQCRSLRGAIENGIDADEADVWLQFLLLGEITYG